MVGGYIYPFEELKLGPNDLVKMYGSVAAVRERVDTVFKCGKPTFLAVVLANGGKTVVPFTASTITANGYNMKAGMFVITVTIDETTAVAVVNISDD